MWHATVVGARLNVGVVVYRRRLSTSFRAGRRGSDPVTAQPVYDQDPDDPVEILRALPEQHHSQFRAEYAAAVEMARRPEQFRQLHELLRLWRLRAVAYSEPGYDQRLEAAREGGADFAPATQMIPGWPGGCQDR
jgi:Family of unknown function (DUF6247)